MDIGLLVLHAVVGIAFAAHGAQKLFGLFGGHGIDGTAGFFEQIGLRPGRLHAWASGIAEFGGGILLALGLFVPFAAAALIAVMVAAVLTVHLPNGFFVSDNGYEYNLELVAVAFALAGVGAGKWSLDAAFGLDIAGTGWALGALAAGLLGGIGAVLAGRIASPARRRGRDHVQTA
jgi:putative oxidoreductase